MPMHPTAVPIDARRWTLRFVATAALAVAALVVALLPLQGTAHAAHFAGETERIRGEGEDANRFGTAAQIARTAFPDGADTVVLARADVFADALAGSFVAGAQDAPILLTERDRLTPVTTGTIGELAATTAVILGGAGAISAAVEQQLRDEGLTVRRIGGADRFATARLIAEDVGEVGTVPVLTDELVQSYDEADTPDGEQRTAILATGERFPDALASGPLSFGGQLPLLLTARDTLVPDARAALESLAIDQVVIPGGTAAISDAVQTEVEELGITVYRAFVAGGDRTATTTEMAKITRLLVHDPYTGAADPLAVATGGDASGGADALALAPLAATRGADLVLTREVEVLNGSPVDGRVEPQAFIEANCAGFGAADTPVVIAGGPSAVSEDVEDVIIRATVCPDFVRSLDMTPEEATAAVGMDVQLALEGINGLSRPAADGVVRIEVYRSVETSDDDGDDDNGLPLPLRQANEDDVVLQEGDRTFVRVQSDNVVLDDSGRTTFAYPGGDGVVATPDDEDRVVACALPDLTEDEQDRSCTVDGELPESVPYGRAVTNVTWDGTVDTVFAFDISGDREVFVEDGMGGGEAGTENALGAAGGPAFGTAQVGIDADEGLVCVTAAMMNAEGSFVAFADAAGVPAVHIHEGSFGANGPVELGFTGITEAGTLGGIASCVELDPSDPDDAQLLTDLEDEPEDYYVNLHTDIWPGGVARGQLDGSGDDIDRSGRPDGEITVTGAREVFVEDDGTLNPLGAAGGHAYGVATVEIDGATVCLDLELSGVEGTVAAFTEATGLPAVHIHEGAFGENGPVELAFAGATDGPDGTVTLSRTCVEAEVGLIEDLRDEPDEYYVNVHTDEWTGGVVRGQLDASWDGQLRTGRR
jgi:putative cell wall-binding protein